MKNTKMWYIGYRYSHRNIKLLELYFHRLL